MSYEPPPYGLPAGQSPMPAPYVLVVGDIGVTDTLIVTPSGSAPLKGSQWIVVDQTFITSKIPNYAIVLAVVLLLVICVFSLLFLLIREDVVSGWVTVTVRSGQLQHTTRIPVTHVHQVAQIQTLVAQAQVLAGR